MKTFTKIVAGLVALSLLLMNPAVALAVPPLPSSFYGTVKSEGVNVPLGTVISAWVNGVKYAEATVNSLYAGDTTYALDVPGDDASTAGLIEGGAPGNAVAFYIGNQLVAQTGVWHSGVNVRFDLALTSAQDTTPPVTTPSVAGALKCSPDVYSNATVTLTPNEPGTTRYRLQPFGGVMGAWQDYASPLALSTEGAHRLEFYSTDAAGNVEATKSIVIKLSTFPTTAVLDNFNRANGRLGTNWYNDSTGVAYRIVGNRVDVLGSRPLYWRAATYGVQQEAYVTLTKVDPTGREQDLLLKVQGTTPNWTAGAIEVLYDARANAVRVETFRPGQPAWTLYPNTPVTFQNGDRLGGRVYANGEVWTYRNCELLGKVTLNTADQNFFNTKGGRIGVWFIDATRAFFDNFGGGTLP